MFEVIIIIDNEEYTYGTYSNEDIANEVAITVKKSVDTYVAEI